MAEYFLQVTAHYFVQPGKRQQVLQLLAALGEASRSEPKNLYYDYFCSPVEDHHIVVLEKYSDENGLNEHRATPHFQTIAVEQIIPLLAKREVESYMVHQP